MEILINSVIDRKFVYERGWDEQMGCYVVGFELPNGETIEAFGETQDEADKDFLDYKYEA